MCDKSKPTRPPDPPDVARKKLFWKLAYAKESFDACKQIAQQYLNDIKSDSHPYYYVFISSTCITYARAFTHGEGVGQLPKRYFRFPDKDLQTTHHTLMQSRHKLYAHNDATVAMYNLTIDARYDGEHVNYSYAIHIPKLLGAIFPNILRLCDFQMGRTGEEMKQMFSQLWPPQTMFQAAHPATSRVVLNW